MLVICIWKNELGIKSFLGVQSSYTIEKDLDSQESPKEININIASTSNTPQKKVGHIGEHEHLKMKVYEFINSRTFAIPVQITQDQGVNREPLTKTINELAEESKIEISYGPKNKIKYISKNSSENNAIDWVVEKITVQFSEIMNVYKYVRYKILIVMPLSKPEMKFSLSKYPFLIQTAMNDCIETSKKELVTSTRPLAIKLAFGFLHLSLMKISIINQKI